MKTEPFTNGVLAILIIVLVSFNILVALSISGDFFNKKKKVDQQSSFKETYFNTVNPWGDTNYVNKDNSLGIDTSVCNWFTYENILGISKNPSILNGLEDFENGFSHLSPPQACIDEDQLVFRTAERTCNGVGSAECIGTQGERYGRQATQNFNSNCSGSGLPACDSTIGSLSFNFFQDPSSDNSPVESGTRFITFSTIFVNQNTYDTIGSDKTKRFYLTEGQLFRVDTDNNLGLKDNQYAPLIRFTGKQDGNFKQNIKLIRYSSDGQNYTPDAQGPYGEFLFRPQSLYLDIGFNEGLGQLSTKGLETTTQNLNSIASQYSDGDKIRKIKYQNKWYQDTCTAIIIGNTVSVVIYKTGSKNYAIGDTINIEDDSGDNYTLEMKVTATKDLSNYFILSTNPKKWLLIPPLNIGGGQIIPRKDRTSLMRSMNQPLDPAWIESGLFSGPGNPDPDGSGLRNCFSKVTPSNEEVLGQMLYSNGTQDLSVSSGDKCLFRNFSTNVMQTDTDLQPEPNPRQIGFWWNMAQRTVQNDAFGAGNFDRGKTLQTGANFTTSIDGSKGDGPSLGSISTPLYPDNYIEDYLKAVNKQKGNVDDRSSDFMTLFPFLGSSYVEKIYANGFQIDYYYKCALTYRVEYPSNFITSYDRDYKDGTVLWNIVNAKSEINVFGYEYFTSSSIIGAGISDFSLTKSGSGYRQPISGSVVNVDYSSAMITDPDQDLDSTEYQGITLTGDISGQSSCIATLIILNDTIISVEITQNGKGYTDGETCSAIITIDNNEKVVINNLVISAQDTVFSYLAFIYIEGQPFPPHGTVDETQSPATNYGFILDPTKVTIKSGVLTLTDKPQNCILSGGSGYIKNDQIAICQLDQDFKSTVSPDNAAVITVTQLDTQNRPFKVHSLMTTKKDPNFQNEPPPDFFTYNFYTQDPDASQQPVYDEAPQQIGYITPELESEINSVITTGGEDQLKTYLFKDSPGGITNIVNIPTLQFESLNYMSVQQGTDPSSSDVIIDQGDSLVLGKFIPYTRFSTAIRQDSKLKYSYDLFNGNNVRFIPNTITDIYTRQFSKTGPNAVPTF